MTLKPTSLEELQRQAEDASQREHYTTVARGIHWLYAQALTPHIAREREREERLAKVRGLLTELAEAEANEETVAVSWVRRRLAAILGEEE
jgi:hypothetical protein